MSNKQLQQAYLDGYIAGLTAYAWWRDGEQQVGSCGTTLKQAIDRAKREHAVRETEDGEYPHKKVFLICHGDVGTDAYTDGYVDWLEQQLAAVEAAAIQQSETVQRDWTSPYESTLLRQRIADLESQLQVAENAHRAANEQMLQAWRERDEARDVARDLMFAWMHQEADYMEAEPYLKNNPWLKDKTNE